MKKITVEEIIRRSRVVHGDKYDYSKVEYTNAQTPICIICPIHGEFRQRYSDHTRGIGCPKCSHKRGGEIRNKRASDEFIGKARKVHGSKYDYSKVEYVNAHKKVCIICPEHGEFWQTPNKHLSCKGCPECSGKLRKNNETFTYHARKIHGDKYDYSKVEYIRNKTKVCIICPEHGEFWQTPNKHLSCKGCPECGKKQISLKIRLSTEEFIDKARKVHGDKYDYSKVVYNKNYEKVCIICPEHGEFWQTPNIHLLGSGCPQCHKFLKHETEIFNKIKENFPDAIHHYRDWVVFKRQEIDIFIPHLNVGIEVQGGQHFKPTDFFGGYKGFLKTCKNDKRKYEICKKNGIKLYYYTNIKKYPIEYIDKLYTNIEELIYEIKNIRD